MREITLKIPEDKLDFFLELVKHLDLEVTESYDIPREHQEIVRQRIQNSDTSKLVSWEQGRKELKFKA